MIAIEHSHDWVYVTRLRYRDPEHTEFMRTYYICECGSGTYEDVPMLAYSL